MVAESPWLPPLPEIAQESLIVTEETNTSSWGDWFTIDTLHVGLDILGFVPVIGIPADLANAGIHAACGNLVIPRLHNEFFWYNEDAVASNGLVCYFSTQKTRKNCRKSSCGDFRIFAQVSACFALKIPG